MQRMLDIIFKQYKCYVTAALILINVLVFVCMMIESSHFDGFTGRYMAKWGAMVTGAMEDGEYYRLFTAMFLHFDLKHIGNNMLVLAAIGSTLERHMGSIPFALVYIIGGLGGNVISAYMYGQEHANVVAAGASGAVFAVIGGLLCLVIFSKGRLENFTLQRMVIFLFLILYEGAANTGVDNYAHVGGLITGFAVGLAYCLLKRSIGGRGAGGDYTFHEYDRNSYG